MSEMRNTFFDRSRNEVATSGEQAATATTTQEPQEATDTDTDTIDVEQTDAVAPADDTPSTEDADADADDAESTDDAEADETTDDDAEDTESDDDNADEAGDRAEVVDEDDVIAEDAAPVALVPVTVEASDAPVGSGDAPATAETAAVESADSDQAEPVVAAAKVEARPAAGVRGNTTIGDGVVSKVVNMVAGKADGVCRLDDADSSVTVDADIATIRIALVVEYGHAVKALAEQVRIDVIDAVEQFLGLDVAAVDVHVSDIHHPEAG